MKMDLYVLHALEWCTFESKKQPVGIIAITAPFLFHKCVSNQNWNSVSDGARHSWNALQSIAVNAFQSYESYMGDLSLFTYEH